MFKCRSSLKTILFCVRNIADLENYNQRILLRVLLLIAKKMITISWLRPQPPTVTQWREKVKDVYYMENIITRLHLKTDVFLNRWSPITSYFID